MSGNRNRFFWLVELVFLLFFYRYCHWGFVFLLRTFLSMRWLCSLFHYSHYSHYSYYFHYLFQLFQLFQLVTPTTPTIPTIPKLSEKTTTKTAITERGNIEHFDLEHCQSLISYLTFLPIWIPYSVLGTLYYSVHLYRQATFQSRAHSPKSKPGSFGCLKCCCYCVSPGLDGESCCERSSIEAINVL